MTDARLHLILGHTAGFTALVTLSFLAYHIAYNVVEQKTSFGLDTIVGGLIFMLAQYAQWAFYHRRNDDDAQTKVS
jgi:cadmium resistance protein CadD (predicted permease)